MVRRSTSSGEDKTEHAPSAPLTQARASAAPTLNHEDRSTRRSAAHATSTSSGTRRPTRPTPSTPDLDQSETTHTRFTTGSRPNGRHLDGDHNHHSTCQPATQAACTISCPQRQRARHTPTPPVASKARPRRPSRPARIRTAATRTATTITTRPDDQPRQAACAMSSARPPTCPAHPNPGFRAKRDRACAVGRAPGGRGALHPTWAGGARGPTRGR